MTDKDVPEIEFPSAADCDGAGYISGWSLALYLVPGEESPDGGPYIETYGCVGAGMPMPAFKGHWLCLGGLGPDVVGEAVVEWLQSKRSTLIALASEYRGRDERTDRGVWSNDAENIALGILDPSEVAHYTEAADWFVDGWEDTFLAVGVDPARQDDRVRADLIEGLKKAAAADKQYVTGIEDFAGSILEEREAAEGGDS